MLVAFEGHQAPAALLETIRRGEAEGVSPGQAALVGSLLAAGKPLTVVALRMPNDREAFPEAGTNLCAWSITAASIQALAAVLIGEAEATGRLPVTLRLPS